MGKAREYEEDAVGLFKNLFNQSSKVLILIVILTGLYLLVTEKDTSINNTVMYGLVLLAALWNRINARKKYSISVKHKNTEITLEADDKQERVTITDD